MNDRFKIRYNKENKHEPTCTNIKSALNLIAFFDDITSKDFVGLSFTVEQLVEVLEDCGDKLMANNKWELR